MRKPSKKQQEVIQYLSKREEASLEDIYANVSWGYYASQMPNMSKFMTKMVNNGTVERVKKGVFRLNKTPKQDKPEAPDYGNQPKLF